MLVVSLLNTIGLPWVDPGWMLYPSSSQLDRRENIMKGSLLEIRSGRDHSPITVMGKPDLTWGKVSFIYYQLNQSRIMRNKAKS